MPDKLSTNYAIGDTYHVRGCDFVVATRTYIARGRHAGGWEILLAPLGQMKGRKNAYALRATIRVGQTTKGIEASHATYGADAIGEAIVKATGTQRAVEDRKEAKAEAGRAVLSPPEALAAGKPAIEAGDVLTIKYSNAVRDEVCVGTNWSTGKVAVEARGYASGKRWLPATMVTAVKKGQKALPFALTPGEQATLATTGWVQARRGREFIERSMVVAKTAEDAKKQGTTYDTPDRKVYQDPSTQMFWRDTGCFD